MDADPPFDEVIAQLRLGQEEAANRVFLRFANQLAALAAGRLNSSLRNKVDPEDVVQSAFRSFFVRHSEGQFSLDNWDALWAVLVVITVRKCGRHFKHFSADRRDVARERGASAETERTGWEAADDEPTVEEVVALNELVERLLGELPELHRPMVTLRLQGHTVAEIASRVGRSERTVHRALDEVKDRVRALFGPAAQRPV